MSNGFEKIKTEQMFSPKAVRHVLKNYCGWRGKLPAVEEITEEHIGWVKNIAEDALAFLRSLPGPIRFRGCGGYSYTFRPGNPLQAVASDGSPVSLKFISDLDEYAGFEGEFIEGIVEEMPDLFDTGYVDQENHELEMLGGTPKKSTGRSPFFAKGTTHNHTPKTNGGFWG